MSLERRHASGTATIAAAGSTSDAIFVEGFRELTLVIPAALTGTALEFDVSVDRGASYARKHWADVAHADEAISIDVTAAKAYSVPPEVLGGVSHVKIVSNDTEAAERSIKWGASS